MKVKELVAELAKVDPNMDIILSSDEEGNSFYELRGVEEMFYSKKWNQANNVLDESDDLMSDSIKVICLWP